MKLQFVILLLLMLSPVYCLNAQVNNKANNVLNERINELKNDVEHLKVENSVLENKVQDINGKFMGSGFILFLFGAFCALWAQNTNRNPWAWFFLGVFFNVIAVLGVLKRNSDDLKLSRS